MEVLAPSRPRGVADLQSIRQDYLLAGKLFGMFESLDETQRSCAPQFVGRLHDRRQREGAWRRPGKLVEAHHANIFRDT